jgi:phosphopantothenoylcysteine decarboxylase/phosphopantothenate--cysteine ligase
VVAPATAHSLARLALGLADDALGTIALAMDAPLVLAPACEPRMWTHAATAGHVRVLADRGAVFVGPVEGRLASGREGLGRMADPDEIVATVVASVGPRDLAGRRIVVTAGPTREPLDPVRYLSNHSSGRMGYAVAEAATARGADVTLISGPVAVPAPRGVTLVHVERAEEMRTAVLDRVGACDALVMAAAVADYRPASPDTGKTKKSASTLTVELVRNPDILSEAAALVGDRPARPILVGFAAETERPWEEGASKRVSKNVDIVLANLVPHAFGADTVRAWLVTADGTRELGEASKREVAHALLDEVLRRWH